MASAVSAGKPRLAMSPGFVETALKPDRQGQVLAHAGLDIAARQPGGLAQGGFRGP